MAFPNEYMDVTFSKGCVSWVQNVMFVVERLLSFFNIRFLRRIQENKAFKKNKIFVLGTIP
jgi:hypothetical protein